MAYCRTWMWIVSEKSTKNPLKLIKPLTHEAIKITKLLVKIFIWYPPTVMFSSQDSHINFIASHERVPQVFKRRDHSKKISEHDLDYHISSVQPNRSNNMAWCHIPVIRRCDPQGTLLSLPRFFLTNWSSQRQTEPYTPEHNTHRAHLQLHKMTAAIKARKGNFGFGCTDTVLEMFWWIKNQKAKYF